MTNVNRMMEVARGENAAVFRSWGERVAAPKRRKPKPRETYEHASGVTGLVVSVAADVFGVSCDDLYSSNRTASVSEVRHAAMYVLRTHFDVSFAQIGRDLHRDHTSVRGGVARAEEHRLASSDFSAALDEISARVDIWRKPVFYRHGALEFKSVRGASE